MRKILWGMFFIIMGVLLVVGQVINLPSVMIIISTLFVGAILVESLLHKNLFFSLMLSATILIINKDYLNIEKISNISILGSAVLLSIGLSILFGHKKRNITTDDVSYEDEDVINIDVSFGSSIKYINSEDFKKATIRCNFAGAQIYFDSATIKEEKAYIDLDISYSGVELYFPKNWKVVNNVNVSLAGIDEKNRNNVTEKEVILTGKVSLAGVEIKYI